MAFTVLKSLFGLRKGKEETRFDEIFKKAVKVQTDGFKKSSLDQREYRSITLENELEVLLISDPKTEKCAASLCVNVGSYSDPPEIPGLAHFLEHMLFMGTEKFPNENEFADFLSKHGGFSNAYTCEEVTNYFFDVVGSEFYGALDRFASFFICPLFAESATTREMQAVDNEFSGNLQNNDCRLYSVVSEIANPKHPKHKFTCGNLDTLQVQPQLNGINIRDELLKFYNIYYSANLMKLVILGNGSLDELQLQVKDLFKDVPNHNAFSPYVHPFPEGLAFSRDAGNICKNVRAVSTIKDNFLQITWYLNPAKSGSKEREAMVYLASILNDESKGSLSFLFKQKSWINAFWAGPYQQDFDQSSFIVYINCTELGFKRRDDILHTVFAYINYLKKMIMTPSKSQFLTIFEDLRVYSAIDFWFEENGSPCDDCKNLAYFWQMSKVSVEDLLTTGSIRKEADMDAVSNLLKKLTPDEANYFVVSDEENPVEYKETLYFKTKYHVEDAPLESIYQWSNASVTKEMDLTLPRKNEFLPRVLDIKRFIKPSFVAPHADSSQFFLNAAESVQIESLVGLNHAQIPDKLSIVKNITVRNADAVWDVDEFRPPVLIFSDASTSLWFKQDTVFTRPITYVQIHLLSPMINESMLSETWTDYFNEIVDDELTKETFQANSVGFNHSFSTTYHGVVLSFSGYSETLKKYLELVLNKYKQMINGMEIEAHVFDRIKENRIQSWRNVAKKSPGAHAKDFYNQLTSMKCFSNETMLRAVSETNLDQIIAAMPKFFDEVASEVLVMGNATPSEAKTYLALITSIFPASGKSSSREFPSVARLVSTADENETCEQVFHLQSAYNPQETTSAVFVRFDLGPVNAEKWALLSVFGGICYERCFDQLRNIEQLGYSVNASIGCNCGIANLTFSIESNSHDPIKLYYRVEAFLERLKADFIDRETFVKSVQAKISALWERPQSLALEASAWWTEMVNGLYQFDDTLKLTKALGNVTLDDLKELLDANLWKGSRNRVKYVGGVLSDNHGTELFGEDYVDKTKRGVEDGVKKGFGKEFVLNWLQLDSQSFETFCTGHGKITIIEDTKAQSLTFQRYPSLDQIYAKF